MGESTGQHMFYPVQVIDGVAGQLGGKALREICASIPIVSPDGVRCPVGHAVITPAPHDLGDNFDSLIHVVPPLWTRNKGIDCEAQQYLLGTAYDSVFERLLEFPSPYTLLCPLLGCGARGVPVSVSIAEAAKSIRQAIKLGSNNGYRVVFALQNHKAAKLLNDELLKVGVFS